MPENSDGDESATIFESIKEEFLIEDSNADGDYLEFHEDGSWPMEFALKVQTRLDIEEGDSKLYDTAKENWAIEANTITRIYNEIDDIYESVSEQEENWKAEANQEDEYRSIAKESEALFEIEASDQIVLYFTLAKEYAQGLMGDILVSKVFEVEVNKEDIAKDFARNISYNSQLDFLHEIGIIDDPLKGDVKEINRIRNDLTHDIRQRQYLDGISDVRLKIDETFDTLDELHLKAHGKSPISGTVVED